MPQSDRYTYSTGDRIRDKRTGEEGRILAVRELGEGIALITVGYFAGGVLRRQFQERVRQGDPGGRIEKLAETGASRITSQAAAQALARRDLPATAEQMTQELGEQAGRFRTKQQEIQALLNIRQVLKERQQYQLIDAGVQKTRLEALSRQAQGLAPGHSRVEQRIQESLDRINDATRRAEKLRAGLPPSLRGQPLAAIERIVENLTPDTEALFQRFRAPAERNLAGQAFVHEQLRRSITRATSMARTEHALFSTFRVPVPGQPGRLRAPSDPSRLNYGFAYDADQEALRLQKLIDQIGTLRSVQAQLTAKHRGVRGMLAYLKGKSTPIKGGIDEWSGSFFSDILRDPIGATSTHKAKRDQILSLLGKSTLTPEFRKAHGARLPAGARTALDVYQALLPGNIADPANPAARQQWDDIAGLLVQAVHASPEQRRLTGQIRTRIPGIIDRLYERRGEILADPNVAARLAWGFGSEDINSTGGRSVRTENELLIRKPYDEFHVSQVVGIDDEAVAAGQRALRRKMSGGIPGRVDITRLKAGSNYQGELEKLAGGQVVQYKGMPFSLAVGPQSRTVVLTPLHTEGLNLQGPNVLQTPGHVHEILKAGGKPAAQQISARLSTQLAATKMVRIQGGLLGRGGAAAIPPELLTAFLYGDVSPALLTQHAPLIRQLGFTGGDAFQRAARERSSRFRSYLEEMLPVEQIRMTMGRVDLEDILAPAHQVVLEELAGLPGSTFSSLGELEFRLGQAARSRTLKQIQAGMRGAGQAFLFSELEEEAERRGKTLSEAVINTPVMRRSAFDPQWVSRTEFERQITQFEGGLFGAAGVDPTAFKDPFRPAVKRLTVGQRLGLVQEVFGPELFEGLEGESRLTAAESIFESAVESARRMRRMGRGAAWSKEVAAPLAERLGLEIFEDDAAFTAALNSYHLKRKQFEAGRGSRQAMVEAARRLEDLRRQTVGGIIAWQASHAQGGTLQAPGQALLGTDARSVALLQSAQGFAEAGELEKVRALGYETRVDRQGRVQVVSQSPAGEAFGFRSLGAGRGAFVSQNDPSLAVFLGDSPAEPITLGFKEAIQALDRGELKGAATRKGEEILLQGVAGAQEAAADRVSQRLTRNAQDELLNRFVKPEPFSVHALRTAGGQGPVAGFQGDEFVRPGSVVQNLQQILRGQKAAVLLDIETNYGGRNPGGILNVFAQRYELVDGQLTPVGEALDLAHPTFWKYQDPSQIRPIAEALKTGNVPEALRTITRNGRTVVIDEVVGTQRELIERTSAFLEANADAAVLGHNIRFDVGQLYQAAQRRGDLRSASALESVARGRVADTMLAAQLAYPGQSSLTLESLIQTLMGTTTPEAHIARPDAQDTAALTNRMLKNREKLLALLDSIQATEFQQGKLVWDVRKRQAYRLLGMADLSAAAGEFEDRFGEELKQPIAAVLQPLDYQTGAPEGPVRLVRAGAPHAWARRFGADFAVIDESDRATLSLAEVQDRARRRIRRMTQEGKSFTKLMDEMVYRQMAQVGEGAQNAVAQSLLSATTANERELLGRAMNYPYLDKSVIRAQVEATTAFWEAEIMNPQGTAAHQPIVEWLQGHVEAAGSERLSQARQEANRVWQEYIRKTQGLTDWNYLQREIPLHERTLAASIDILGQNKRKLRVGTEAGARSDVSWLLREIGRQLPEGAFDPVFQDAAPAEIGAFVQNLRAGKNVLDSDLGPRAEQFLYSRYLQPALGLQAGTVNEAIPELMQRGLTEAQIKAERIPDQLTPRLFDPEQLAALQAEMTGQSPGVLARQLDGEKTSRLILQSRHNAPSEWVGRGVEELLEAGMDPEGADRESLPYNLRHIARGMSPQETGILHELLLQASPRLAGQVFPRGAGVAEEMADLALQASTRKFSPGILNTGGMELAEALVGQGQNLQRFGRVGLGLAGAGLLFKALTAPGDPSPEEAGPDGFGSTETQQKRREQRQLSEQLLMNQVRITIFGEDPVGIDPHEITSSVHEALGSFFGEELAHQAQVQDERAKIDGRYLEHVAGRLLSPGRR